MAVALDSVDAPPQPTRKPARSRASRWTPGKVVLTLVAYTIAVIFLLPTRK